MNFFDFVKRALGLPPNPPISDGSPNYFHRPFNEHDEEDDNNEEDEFSNVPSSPFGFHVFAIDPMDMHQYFEDHVNEMLKSFRAMQGNLFGSGLTELPDFNEGYHEGMKDPLTEEEIRDRYLKPSLRDTLPMPSAKTDIDLDDEVSTKGLKSVIESSPDDNMALDVPPRVFGQSVISKTVRLPDGRIEHEKRVRRSDGNEEVTITRQLGDKKYTVTTTTDRTGTEQKTEEFVNLDQGELNEFERKWSSRAMNKPETSQQYKQLPPLSTPDSSLLKIIESLFK